jgi:uncharacterized membrane-anchored protein YhcB (DUF1043 family)
MDKNPSWQSTLIALAFILLVGAIFLTVYTHSGVDDALKTWAAIGTLVGVITGAIPTYFFGSAAVKAARDDANQAKQSLDTERNRTIQLQERTALLSAVADPQVVAQARQERPDLFTLE